MRALWLHFPSDPKSIECADQYMWGPNVMVAPVLEKGATTRRVYLPPCPWFDFWTGERLEGSREIERVVDLETLPLFVRAGSILPMGPVKQYSAEKVDTPLSLSIYPGADASFLIYEDDGKSFNYRRGEWMGIQVKWNDAGRKLDLSLYPGSRMLPPAPRAIDVQLGKAIKSISFRGAPVSVGF